MHTVAPDRYRGLLCREKLARKSYEVVLNSKKPFSFLKGFAMNTAAPDRYRGLLERDELLRKCNDKALNSKRS